MKKSILTFAIAAVVLASCKKSNDVAPTGSAVTSAASLSKHSGTDDVPKKGGMDDNQPKHSGNDEKNTTVPAKVAAAFSQSFPGSVAREWKLTSDGLYKVHFSNKGVAWEASFSPNGALVKSQRAK